MSVVTTSGFGRRSTIANDPVPRFRAQLIESGVASEDQLAGLEAAIEKEIDEAVEFALASDFPGVEELKRDVFAEELA